ncbi:hypothetical protein, partial [Streptomyces sp. NPDC058622]|uniref:hypothetical protein n=1 Tax=Streptomyces sp. NPDC058622 TaxID=3346562 RepID=UPI0036635289
MTTANPGGTPADRRTTSADVSGHRTRRLSTETKSALKTTELFVYIAAVIAVLIASMLVGTEEGHRDYFRADQ